MAYVPNCKCDVFVSFAHIDDAAIGDSPQWVSAFASDLEKMLRFRLGLSAGDELKLFLSGHATSERGASHEAAALEHASSAAVFLAVTSPAYAEDARTMRELSAFRKGMGEGERIFAIEHSPIHQADGYPASLRDVKRDVFWQRHLKRDVLLTVAIGSQTYLQALFDLAEQVRKQLKRMKAASVSIAEAARFASSDSPAKLPGEGGAIFLAQATDDLDEEREEVRRYLEQFGIAVLPKNLYPHDGTEFANALEADLGRVQAFVQLLGRTPARRPPDMPLGFDRLQFERAVARGLPIMQWLRPGFDPAAVADREHLKLLSGENVRRTGLESFKAEIMQRIGKPSAPPPGKPFIFINADRIDTRLAETLRREFRTSGLRAAIPALLGSSQDVRLDLEENLVACEALVTVYGESTPDWVRGQLRLYSKVKHRRKQPLKTSALYLGPPESKPDIGMELPEITKIDCRESASVESLRQLLAEPRQ